MLAPIHVGIGVLNQGLDILPFLRVNRQADRSARLCPRRWRIKRQQRRAQELLELSLIHI